MLPLAPGANVPAGPVDAVASSCKLLSVTAGSLGSHRLALSAERMNTGAGAAVVPVLV